MDKRFTLRAHLRTHVPAYLLLALTGPAVAQPVEVSTEAEYNAALAAADGLIYVTGPGFDITAMPAAAPAGNTLYIGSNNGFGNPRPVLNGGGGNYHAYTTGGAGSKLGFIYGIDIENFGSVALMLADSTNYITLGDMRFTNNINSSSAYSGGAIVAGSLTSVSNTVFTGNRVSTSGGNGGAIAVVSGGMDEGISDSDFTNNAAIDGAGGAVSVAGAIQSITHSDFTGNAARGSGGAVSASAISGISESRFVDNVGSQGGAVYAPGGAGSIYRSVFVGNRTHNDAANPSAHGGALVTAGNMSIGGSWFVANHAQGGAAAGGLGGAIYHKNDGGSTDNEIQFNSSTFYGNRHNPGNTGDVYNAMMLDGQAGETTRLRVYSYEDAVRMLDPLSVSPLLATTVTKDGEYGWNLGGVNTFAGASTWNINEGALILTDVHYDDASAPVAAAVNLTHAASSFTLNTGGVVSGSGQIQASSMTLSGTVAPSVVANVGQRVADGYSTTGLPLAMDVVETSPFGSLTFVGEATMDAATLAINTSDTDHSRLTIDGNLTLAGSDNTVQVNFVDDSVGAVNNLTVLQTTGSISGTEVKAATHSFLKATGTATVVGGNQVQVSMAAPTLVWNDTDVDAGSGKSLADGEFKVDRGMSFTVTGALADRTDVIADGGAHGGWDGKSLTKTGGGTLALNGVNTYTGTTDVQAGTLIVGTTPAHSDAVLAGPVNVQYRATLGGHGTLAGGLTTDWNANVSPGTATRTGTLTFVGDTNFGSTNLNLRVNPDGSHDKLVVTTGYAVVSSAHLYIGSGGAAGAGTWATSQTYTILEAAGGLQNGWGGQDYVEFPDYNVTNNLTFFDHELHYADDLTRVDLTLTRNASTYASYGETGNQVGVAEAIAALDDAHAVKNAVTGLDAADVANAYDNLSGEIYASMRPALLANTRLRNSVLARMQGLGADFAAAQPVMLASTAATPRVNLNKPSQRLWVNTWAYGGDTDGNRNAAKTDHSGIGLAFGGDVRVSDSVTAGVLFGYEDGKVKNGGTRRSRTDVDSYSLGGYATANVNGISLQGGVIYSHLKLDASRSITVGGLAGKARASYDGYKVQAFVEAGKALEVGDAATVTPYVNLTQTWLHTDAAREKGSAAALRIGAQNDSVTQTTLGLRTAYRLPVEMPVALTANLGWAHAFGDTNGKTQNRFGPAGNRFSVQGVRMARDRALVGVGLEARITSNATLTVGYDGQFGSAMRDHSGSVQVRVKF